MKARFVWPRRADAAACHQQFAGIFRCQKTITYMHIFGTVEQLMIVGKPWRLEAAPSTSLEQNMSLMVGTFQAKTDQVECEQNGISHRVSCFTGPSSQFALINRAVDLWTFCVELCDSKTNGWRPFLIFQCNVSRVMTILSRARMNPRVPHRRPSNEGYRSVVIRW
jgi:hypothetical protein